MKTLIQNHPETVATIAALLVFAIGFAAYYFFIYSSNSAILNFTH